MDKNILHQFENLFLELKIQTANQILEQIKIEEMNLSLEKGDEVDHTQNELSQALKLKLLSRDSFMLKKIDSVLLKIKNGSFGVCEECEGEIELGRLYARPVATQCISCKEESEKTEGQLLYHKRSHTHGKSFGKKIHILNNLHSFNATSFDELASF